MTSKEEFEEAKKNKETHRLSIQIFTGVHGVVPIIASPIQP
jgi:hypothetical protein